jgi:N-acetylmuramoyl-L-alanine amidase
LDGGAVSTDGTSEHEFNSELAGLVQEKLLAAGIDSAIFDVYRGSGYTAAMVDVATQVRKYGADIALEFHFNSSDDPKSNGYEYLHWHTSKNAARLATIFLSEHGRYFRQARARGLVPIDSEQKRGGGFLKRTPCPAVILEPFFGSSPKEWASYSSDLNRLADMYSSAIAKYFAK